MTLPRRVRIVEVGPRDGLQNEPARVDTTAKIAFVDALADSGHQTIEVSAFVSPKWVPQMADAAEVFAGIHRQEGVAYTALVPNLAGLTRAHEAGVSEVAIFAAASDTFSRRNINQSVPESLDAYAVLCAEAQRLSLRVRAYVSTVFGCPFEGVVSVDTVTAIAERLIEMGAYEVALSDTIGIAHPGQVPEVLEAVTRRISLSSVALHFHDTRGAALVNVFAALQYGVTTFDSSAGGLGGCPYAPGATGNLATEDLIYMLDGLGIETGVRLKGVIDASRAIEAQVGHPLPSRVYRATLAGART